jgi:hypothetical protein
MEWLDRSLIVAHRYITLCLSEEAYEAVMKEIEYDCKNDPWLSNGKGGKVHFIDADGAEQNTDLHGKKFAVVCLGNASKHSLIEIHGLLLHEAVHIWQDFIEYIGENDPSHEFEAYSIQWIAQQLFWSYEDQTKAVN